MWSWDKDEHIHIFVKIISFTLYTGMQSTLGMGTNKIVEKEQ